MAKRRELTVAQAERVVKWNQGSLGIVPFIVTLPGAVASLFSAIYVLRGDSDFTQHLGFALAITVFSGIFGWINVRRLNLQPEALRVLGRNS